jgi:hypothetical protein
MKLCARASLQTMRRGLSAEGLKIFSRLGIKFSCDVDKAAALCKTLNISIYHGNHAVAVFYGNGPAGAKIPLYINNDKGLFIRTHIILLKKFVIKRLSSFEIESRPVTALAE